MNKYDYVVLGSGFGGATVALRLVEAGKSVLVLERGVRFAGKNLLALKREEQSIAYPELGDKNFFWARSLLNPFRQRMGLFQLRQFKQLQGLVAAGLGGGSLIWANVVVEAHEEAFHKGWPVGIKLETLAQYYGMAREYLRPASIPGSPSFDGRSGAGQIHRAELHRLAAERIGEPWRPVEIAVNFGDEHKPLPNGFGSARQLGCNFCGLCSAGCPQSAKNTVDRSYIAAAEALGAELATGHEVEAIEADEHGYILHLRHYDAEGRLKKRLRLQANKVVLACGSFGSTELLLRSRSRGLLKGLSPALGSKFSINGNVLSAALDPLGEGRFNNGPAISSMIDFGNYAVEDFANPSWAAGMVGSSQFWRAYYFMRAYLGFKLSPEKLAALTQDLLIYVGVGMDSSSGRLKLNSFGQLAIDWPGLASEPAIEAQHRAQKSIAESLGRQYVPDVFSTFGRQFTYHPLGGCPMADSRQEGVVNQFGEVYGHPGLYVADGSIVPTALGRNPAYTICALSERVAERITTG